jgi:hypothetical protein
VAAKLYVDSIAAANRRDVPSLTSVTGSLIASVAWAADGNRKGWARYDPATELAYFEIEALSATTVEVRAKTKLGDDTVDSSPYTIAAAGVYTNLVPGVSITFAGTITTGHKSRIWAASYMLASNAIFVPRGSAGDWQKWYFENADAFDYMLTAVIAGRGTRYENTSGTALAGLRAIVVNPVADTYAMTISNGTPGGKYFTFTGGLNTYESNNISALSTANPFDDDTTTGLTFDAGSAPANTDTATIYVSDLADCLEMCPDNAGSPDTGNIVTWDASDGVVHPVSRVGYTDQLIPAGGTRAFWIRANPAAGHAIGRGNARLYPYYQVAE